MTRPLGCFCGSYNRVGVHAYGCPADEPACPDDETSEDELAEDEEQSA